MSRTTIDITPVFNTKAIKRYTDDHSTSDPQEHISGRLEELAALAERVVEIEQRYRDDKDRWHYLRDAVTRAHREASLDLLSFFGDPDAALIAEHEERTGEKWPARS